MIKMWHCPNPQILVLFFRFFVLVVYISRCLKLSCISLVLIVWFHLFLAVMFQFCFLVCCCCCWWWWYCWCFCCLDIWINRGCNFLPSEIDHCLLCFFCFFWFIHLFLNSLTLVEILKYSGTFRSYRTAQEAWNDLLLFFSLNEEQWWRIWKEKNKWVEIEFLLTRIELIKTRRK